MSIGNFSPLFKHFWQSVVAEACDLPPPLYRIAIVLYSTKGLDVKEGTSSSRTRQDPIQPTVRAVESAR